MPPAASAPGCAPDRAVQARCVSVCFYRLTDQLSPVTYQSVCTLRLNLSRQMLRAPENSITRRALGTPSGRLLEFFIQSGKRDHEIRERQQLKVRRIQL